MIGQFCPSVKPGARAGLGDRGIHRIFRDLVSRFGIMGAMELALVGLVGDYWPSCSERASVSTFAGGIELRSTPKRSWNGGSKSTRA